MSFPFLNKTNVFLPPLFFRNPYGSALNLLEVKNIWVWIAESYFLHIATYEYIFAHWASCLKRPDFVGSKKYPLFLCLTSDISVCLHLLQV